MSRILVLGGSYLQSDFVDTAVNLNHDVYVLDREPDCFLANGKGISFKAIDIADVDAVNNYYDDNNCDIVVSPVTEIGNRTASRIAAKHGLPYNKESTVVATTDKSVMRQKLRDAATLKEPWTYTLSPDSATISLPNYIQYPFIVKPPVSSASRGVTLVSDEKEFQEAMHRAAKYCRVGDNILLEQFIEGEQYSIETISFHGKHYLLAIVREHLSGVPYFMERMDTISCKENEELAEEVEGFVIELLGVLDVTFGPCHIEVKIDREKNIQLIEVASRSGLLRDKLIKAAKGVDYNKLILEAYSGIDISSSITKVRCDAMLGIIAYKEDELVLRRAKEAGYCIDEYHYPDKTFADTPSMLTDATGYFFLRGNIAALNKYSVKL